MTHKARQGDWVQIHNVILPAGQRAPQVPDDTQKVPLEMWLKGFLDDLEAEIGQDVTITTVTGRHVEGKLVTIAPSYPHDFGQPVPELQSLGLELRAMLESAPGENQ